MTQGDLVTVVGRHHLTVNEAVKGKQVLVKLGYGDTSHVISVPERFVAFAKTGTTPLAPSSDTEVIGRDKTVRKSYYGDGEQPWDVMRRKGWGAVFCGGNILKYLRRTKNEDDIVKARWYWTELKKMTDQEVFPAERARAALVLTQLLQELTEDEHHRLTPLSEFPEGTLDPALVK